MPRTKRRIPLEENPPKIPREIDKNGRVTYSSAKKEVAKERIIQALSLGCFIKEACDYGGVWYKTYQSWYNSDKKFREKVIATIAQGEVLLLAEIRRDPSWQAKAWILERRFRERWARDIPLAGENMPKHITLTWQGEGGVEKTLEAKIGTAAEERAATVNAIEANAEEQQEDEEE